MCFSDLMANVDTVIDRMQGCVLVINGDIFYSPNSSRQVAAPPPPIPQHNIFNYRSVCLADFSQPRWWSAEFGWLSFVSLSPSFASFPFDCLTCIPYYCEVVDAGYRFNSNVAGRWSKLDSFLLYITTSLIKAAKVSIIRPFSPWAFGYLDAFKHTGTPHRRATLGRDWFVIWMGMLSYLIAIVDNHRTSTLDDAVPTWFEILATLGFDQGWLSGIHSSTVCSFSPFTPRTGVFVHLCEEDRSLPPIDFFCKYHVPVWYPWGPQQEKRAANHHWFTAYAPLPEQLQAATSSLVRIPSPPPRSRVRPNTAEGSAPTSEKKARQTWHEFFAARDKRHAEMEKRESTSNRQKRLNRQQKPPTKKTKVFRWLVSLDHDADPDQRFRTLITRKEHDDWLDYYSSEQKRYDAWENEWDLCTEFGDDDLDLYLDQSDGIISYTTETVDPHLRDEPPPSFSRYHQRSPSPAPLTGESDDAPPAMTESSDFVQLLAQRYGFVPSLTVSPNTAGAVDQKQWDKCMRAIGLRQLDGNISSSPLDKTVIDFIQKIIRAERPGENEWDLDSNNRNALVATGRVLHVCCINKDIFLFTFPASSFPWKLALTNAVDALYVCRLDVGLDQYDVARRLIEQGIAFRTLLPLRIIPSLAQPPSLSRLIPIRLSGYNFTTRDYATYQRQRDAILASPQGRAALLRGGIIWRLARDSLSFDGALQGPSITTTVHRNGFSLEYLPSGGQLWDDDLSTEELDLISGAYCCYTGLFQQLIIILLFATDWSI